MVEKELVSVTVALVEQMPFVIVHLNTAGLVLTVTELIGEFASLKVAAPLTTVHVPVSPAPTPFAAKVNKLLLQLD